MSVAWSKGVRGGVEDGIEWKVLLSPLGNALNGYARIPTGHPWSGKDYDDIERTGAVDVHGGLTFADEGWIGFDTAHAWDYWPTDELTRVGGRRSPYELTPRGHTLLWTVERIVAEAKGLARQVAEASRAEQGA